jgi:hypothetical protein
MKIFNRHKSSEQGVIMIGALMALFFFMIVALSIAEYGSRQYLSTRRTLVALSALSLAEGGVDKFMVEINNVSTYSGSGGEVTLYNDSVKGKGTYQTSVTNGTITNEKVVTSIGKVYLPATATTPLVTRSVRVTIIGTSPIPYTVQSGPGGLIMTNGATIGAGDLYINGYLTMTNNSRIGSVSTPSNVYVANANCPVGGGATYPVVCNSGQPISISNPAWIYGIVRATGQTDGSRMSNTGLVSGSTAPVLDMPGDDRASQVAAVTSTVTGAASGCGQNQTRTWQANTHITGSVTIDHNCVVTVKGDVWIDGTLNIANQAVIKVDDSATVNPRVMVDGSTGVSLLNSAAVAANTAGVGFRFVTYYSAASCSPDCGDVTGIDLYNSRNLSTMNLNNGSLGAGSVFYARWSKITISNNGTVGAMIGQTVELDNTGTISFAPIIGGGGGGASVWDIHYYQRVFN